MYRSQTMIKTSWLVMFRLAQSWFIYLKLEKAIAKVIYASQPGSIHQSLGSINQKSGQRHFSAKFQLNPSFVLKRLEFSNLP